MQLNKQIALILSITMLAGCAGRENEPAEQPDTATSETQLEAVPQAEEIALSDIAKKGKIVFLKCRSCHTVNQGDVHLTGPNLHGFYDAKAGTREGYVYSDALKSSDLSWDKKTLDGWLEKPTQSIPGTKMVFAGLPSKEDREAVDAYLKEVTQ